MPSSFDDEGLVHTYTCTYTCTVLVHTYVRMYCSTIQLSRLVLSLRDGICGITYYLLQDAININRVMPREHRRDS